MGRRARSWGAPWSVGAHHWPGRPGCRRCGPLWRPLSRGGLPPLASLSSESSLTRTSALASLPSLMPCLSLTAANAFFQSRWSKDESSSSCTFLRGLGVPPVSSGLRTPPSNLAACGGFWCPKLFETFGVLRPPGAYLPCFFPADVVTATAPAAPPSAESIQRIWSNGLMLGGVFRTQIRSSRLLHGQDLW